MSTERHRDAEMDRLLRATLRPGSVPGAGECPDAGMMAAYVEGTLPADDRASLDAHYAACGRCQDALATLARIEPQPSDQPVSKPWLWRGHLHWLIPVSAAAALVLYIAGRPLIAPTALPATEGTPVLAPGTPFSVPAADSESAQAPPASIAARREAEATGNGAAEAPVRPPTGPKAAPAQTQQAVVGAAPEAVPPAPVASDSARSQARESDKRDRALTAAAKEGPVVVMSLDGTVGWRLEKSGGIWRSADRGLTWYAQTSGVAADLLAGSAPSVTTCWAVGVAGTVLLTDDGERWMRRPFPERVDLLGIEASSSHRATVTTRDGRQFTTDDGGRTWSRRRD